MQERNENAATDPDPQDNLPMTSTQTAMLARLVTAAETMAAYGRTQRSLRRLWVTVITAGTIGALLLLIALGGLYTIVLRISDGQSITHRLLVDVENVTDPAKPGAQANQAATAALVFKLEVCDHAYVDHDLLRTPLPLDDHGKQLCP